VEAQNLLFITMSNIIVGLIYLGTQDFYLGYTDIKRSS